MCARRPTLAHTWERATVNHVRVSGFEQRRGLLRVRRTEGRTDGRMDCGKEESLALLLGGAQTRPRSFNLTLHPQGEIEEKKTRGGGGRRAAEGTRRTTSAHCRSCQIDFYFALLVFLRRAIITLTCLLARGRRKKKDSKKERMDDDEL